MKSHSGKDVNNTTKIKAIAALPAIGGLIVGAALLSVLLIPISSSYQQPAMAQLQNTTDTNGTITSGGTPTTTGAGQSACTPAQRGAAGGTNATSGSNTTRSTTETNATSTIAGGAAGNQSTTSQLRLLIEEACIAAQNNNTQGILMQLNRVLNALEGAGTQGNTSTAISALDLATTSTDGEEQLSVDRTSDAEGDDGADDGTGGNDRDGGDSTSTSSSSTTTTGSTNTTADNGGTNANTPERGTAEQDSDCGGITVGGTSAADDYGCADPDAE